MRYGFQKDVKPLRANLNGFKLSIKDSTKYLGVDFHSKLNGKLNAEERVNKPVLPFTT